VKDISFPYFVTSPLIAWNNFTC